MGAEGGEGFLAMGGEPLGGSDEETVVVGELAIRDSEKALGLDSENIRALFRKARALTELGRHKEAYACSSRCSLALPHVSAASLAEARLPILPGPKRLTPLSLAVLR